MRLFCFYGINLFAGVYHHITGKPLGYLTVKLVGFNDTAKPWHWIATNSWGRKWGDNGVFRIQKYSGECLIDGSIRGVVIKNDDHSEKLTEG